MTVKKLLHEIMVELIYSLEDSVFCTALTVTYIKK